jgi:glycosyltransferase involved in cell wall biosynthesis
MHKQTMLKRMATLFPADSTRPKTTHLSDTRPVSARRAASLHAERSRFDRPLRLVVMLEQDNSSGGGYQQATNAALLLKGLPSDLCTVVYVTTRRSSLEELRRNGVDAQYFHMPRWQRLLERMRVNWRLFNAWPFFSRKRLTLNFFDRFLARIDADLVYFTCPSYLALVTEQYNYLFTVWDLSHRDEVDFPEIRARGEFERRERLFSTTLSKATGVIVDSEAGRDNVVRRYQVDYERVHHVPFSPSVGTLLSDDEYAARYVDVKSTYGLTCDYVYYPAQFWPHKNHVYLLKGLRALYDCYGIRMGAIFSGRDFGNLAHVQAVADELGLSEWVRFAGFVPDDHLAYLYRQSVALVMPTYFGPTNLPPLEAFRLGVPVLYPDMEHLRDQVGDAALLMNLTDPESMAAALHRLMTEPALRRTLIERGKRQIALLTDEQRLRPIQGALEKYRARRLCWGESAWAQRKPTGVKAARGASSAFPAASKGR